MATSVKGKLKKISETPEALLAKKMEERIMEKLNHDGRWAVLHPMEGMVRLGSLTNAESDFLGNMMGWLVPYYRGVDWENVPSAMLAAAIMETDSMKILQDCYPAPPEASLIEWDQVSKDDLNDFAEKNISLQALVQKYSVQVGGRVKP